MLLLCIVILAGCGTEVKEPPPRDTSGDTKLSASMVYANSIANKVQAYYDRPDRSSYTITNTQIELVHDLMKPGSKYVTALKSNKGKTYLKNTMDIFVKDTDGNVYYASKSPSAGRINTTRLGYYYYESHVRDLGFGQSDVSVYGKKLDLGGFNHGSWHKNKDVKDVYYKDGTMVIEIASGADPYVSRTGIHVDPATYNAVEITMKVEGDAQSAQLYFYTLDTSGFNENQKINFSVNADGKYHTYLLDLMGSGVFNSPMVGIRLDVGSAAGEKVTVKSLNAVQTDASSVPLKLEKTFHTYSDKLHQEYRLIAANDCDVLGAFGLEVKISKKTVSKIQYKDKNGTGTNIKKLDGGSIEYIAFDIKKVGVIGFIIPPDGSTSYCTVTEDKNNYIFTQYANVTDNTLKKMEEIIFGSRVYTDTTHSFKGIEKACDIERNPLVDITVTGEANGQFYGYDHMVGMYKFDMDGSDFNKAFYREPDKHFDATILMKNDNRNRDLYIWFNTDNECLESAAILDDTNTQVPIPLQVGKNFVYEKEEPFYDPEDVMYGDTIFPLRFKENEESQFTVLNLYQNWGKYPLKQLSWIQFHVSYYHLSTGVTESNCIAPYYVYGKDGWTLPDFRGASGIMWSGQPQFNSVGRLYFLSYINSKGKKVMTEYTDSYIRSSGNTYVDMDYSYISDCGSFKYVLRHIEFPQKDENRTYYSLRLEFLKDLTIDNVRENLSLFTFDSRNNKFYQAAYLDENNQPQNISIDVSQPNSQIYKLGDQSPYFAFFDLEKKEQDMNFGFILKSSSARIGKKKYNGGFVFKNTFDGQISIGTLSLDLGKVKFRKGDYINLDFILLPYGSFKVKSDDNVRYVREDSCLKPLSIEAIKGEVVKDTYLPRIKCENNQAEFTIIGGRNNNVVRVDGFTNIKKPRIYELVDGEYVPIEFSVHEYDGYTVHFNRNGTYSFSFVFEMESPDSGRTFKVEN
jgi:hypothetical protein